MKYFVVSDVHSYYTPLRKALDDAGFDPNNENHTLISCGDLFDRGTESKELLNYIMALPRKILIKGNHDTMLEDLILKGKQPDYYDIRNGTIRTVCSLGDSLDPEEAIKNIKEKHILDEYFNTLQNYFETDKYLFVHCWFPHLSPNSPLPYDYTIYKKASDKEWEKAMWDNPYLYWQKMIQRQDIYGKIDKTVVFGHWHTSFAHSTFHKDGKEFPDENDIWKNVCNFKPFYDDGVIGLDACTVFTRMVNCVVLED